MAVYITIDGGTTNMRISLVNNGHVVDTLKYSVGAKDGVEDKTVIKKTVKEGITRILSRNAMRESDITRILASGMITSESGLFPLEHIYLPAGIEELKKTSYEVVIKDVTDIPFVFVRGIKTNNHCLNDADMMRGEETELMGIVNNDSSAIYALMGSHTKLVQVDKKGKICDFTTMLTGELISAISRHTILKESFKITDCEIDNEYLIKGYELCKKIGLGEALFKVRILKNLFLAENDKVYSFFMGTILCNEVSYILKKDIKKVVIGGNRALKTALAKMIRQITDIEVVCLEDEVVDKSVSMGLIKIYESNIVQ